MPSKITKRPRTSSSSLSDAEEPDDDDDDEEEPLAARMAPSRHPPGKRTSGKQNPGKKSKKSHTSRGGPSSASTEIHQPIPTANGRVNGINGHIKVEDTRMDEAQLNGLTAGVPLDTTGRSSAAVSPSACIPAAVELKSCLSHPSERRKNQQSN